MKTWTEADIKELQINETAYGISILEEPDSERTMVCIDGEWGWEIEYGESPRKPQ